MKESKESDGILGNVSFCGNGNLSGVICLH
jgi:hypothetical protein